MEKYNVDNCIHNQLTVKASGEKLSLSTVLSEFFKFKDIFIVHEILLPGRRDSLPHYHTKKEEMIFVLAGNLVVNLGNDKIELAPGDFIGLSALGELHYLENLSDKEAKYLKICSNPKDDKVKFDALNKPPL